MEHTAKCLSGLSMVSSGANSHYLLSAPANTCLLDKLGQGNCCYLEFKQLMNN